MTDGAKTSWFQPEFQGSPRDFTLGTLEYYKRMLATDRDSALTWRPDQEYVLGHPIPEFQRPAVWDLGQKVRFVESAARGLHLGTWVYNDASAAPYERIGGREFPHRTDRWLLDGQQRFRALEDFLDDKFPVFGLRWSEIPIVDKRRFLNQNFSAYEVRMTDERDLRRVYDRLNFGGTPHTPDQRAMPEEEDEPASGPGFR